MLRNKTNLIIISGFIVSTIFFIEIVLKFPATALLLKNGEYILNLVNKENTLNKYVPPDLVEISSLGAPGKYIREVVYNDLEILLENSQNKGLHIKILSAYRSYQKQRLLFLWYKKTYKAAEKFSAEAGHSEHQLGTTIDFGIGDPAVDFKKLFADTSEGLWLRENAFKYGFVMSYPKDKENITGYTYEPWHYRYVGPAAAKEIYYSGLTLQEYLSEKPQYYDYTNSELY